MAEHRLGTFAATADRHRDQLVALYGRQHGEAVKYAEAFETCEYGAALTPERLQLLFPFVG